MVHASRNLLFDRANDERPRSLWFVGEKRKKIELEASHAGAWRDDGDWKSFRPPRKTQISYSLHFNTWLFSILSGFLNLWLWWSRAEGAAAAVWLQKSLGCDVILWKRIDFSCTRLLFFPSLLFCLVLLFFMLRTGNDHFRLWWNDIAAHGYCCRLFPEKKSNWTAWRHVVLFYNLRLWWKRSGQETAFPVIRQRPPLSPSFPIFCLL